ncbi:MAG: hypothetical protein PHX05_03380, partial [Acidobacteriota bacterium]|nr:hypothetical protein [Acidobacteriota bacterium]
CYLSNSPKSLIVPIRPVVAGFINGMGTRRFSVKRLGAACQFECHGQAAAYGYFIALRNRFFLLAFFTAVCFSRHRSSSFTTT